MINSAISMVKEDVMRKNGKRFGFTGMLAALSLIAIACAPAADPTATTAPAAPTATTAAAATATTAAAPTATTSSAAATATRDTSGGVTDGRYPASVAVVDTPAPNPEAERGGIMRWVERTEASDFSGWEGAASEPRHSAPVYDTLLEYNAFEGFFSEDILPKLANDWWVNADGTVWTFKLEEATYTHPDGSQTPFTCADAEFTLETIRVGHDETGDELRRSPRAGYLRRVTDTTCADNRTLQITTDGPLPSLPGNLALGYLQVRSKAYFEGNLEAMLDDHGPAIGPFTFEARQPSESLSFTRNPNYWNQPYPYLDGIEYSFLGSNSAAEAAFRVGRAELGTTTPGNRPVLIEEGFLKHTEKYSSHGFRGLQTNFTRAPWNDPRFSQALRCAIDGQKATNTGYNGFGFEGPIFPLVETPGGSQWGLNKEEWMELGPCHGPSSETDMDARRDIALGLLADMGFTAENPARPFTYVWTPTSVSDHWPSVLDDLKQVNIIPDAEAIETARAYDKNYAGEFDFNIWSYSTARADPDTWLFEHYLSTSDRNYGKYTNPEVDALLDLQSITLDKQERVDIVKDISRILLRDNAKIILVHYGAQLFWAPWLMDYYQSVGTTGATYHRFERVWIDQAIKDELGK